MDKNTKFETLRELFHTAILVNVSDTALRHHPIRLLQAVKSLIGLNLKDPNTRLLDWLKKYITSFAIFPVDRLKIAFTPPTGNVSYDALSEAIRDRDSAALELEIGKLRAVASADQLLEFLLEQAMTGATAQFLCLWSAHRMVRFLGSEHSAKILRFNTDTLLRVEPVAEMSENQQLVDYETSAAVSQVLNENFIRERNIHRQAEQIKNHVESPDQEFRVPSVGKRDVKKLITNFCAEPSGIDPDLVAGLSVHESRQWIWDFVVGLPTQKLSPDLLLCLDAGRALLKNSAPHRWANIGFQFGKNIERICNA